MGEKLHRCPMKNGHTTDLAFLHLGNHAPPALTFSSALCCLIPFEFFYPSSSSLSLFFPYFPVLTPLLSQFKLTSGTHHHGSPFPAVLWCWPGPAAQERAGVSFQWMMLMRYAGLDFLINGYLTLLPFSGPIYLVSSRGRG